MSWHFETPSKVVHETGFSLTLEAGSWKDPSSLSPGIPSDMLVRDAALLLREGLIFASRKDRKVKKPEVRPVPGKNTLSLKR